MNKEYASEIYVDFGPKETEDYNVDKSDYVSEIYVDSDSKEPEDYNVGKSDYASHSIQPWDIWEEYHLNPWDADIVKRVLRIKEEGGMSKTESRILDYEKIIHICKKRIKQLKNGYEF